MSYDEIPPSADSSPQSEETNADSAREPSSSDAPPPARPRRRRSLAAETTNQDNAASTETEKPARAPRSRRRPAAEAATNPETAEPAETTDANTPRPAPRRAARVRKPAENPPEATEQSVPPAEPETAPARPVRRRAARPPAADQTPASVGDAPAPERAESAPPEAEEDRAADATTEAERPARRRGGRGRRRGATPSEEPITPENAETALPPSEAPETAPAPETEEGDPEERDDRNRRRRGGRRGKGRPDAPEETPAPISIPLAAAAVPVAPPEPEYPSVRVLHPEPDLDEHTRDRTQGAHLNWKHGVPEIHINGVAYPPVFFFGNMDGDENRDKVLAEVRLAARAGVHLHSALIELPCPLVTPSAALDEIDKRIRDLHEADPEGWFMPRIVFVPARGWKRQNPSEVATYADGTMGDPSIASERFRQEVERSLAALVARFRESEWGRRVFAYHLERGEWFQPADQGFDRSPANRDAFRDWLRDKYRNNVVALRASWRDGDVQFHTAEIPPALAKPDPRMSFFDPRRERRIIDFCEFTSESTARTIILLARAVKRAAHNQALVSVCYGYTFEFGHPFSGHLALGMLLSAQAINILSGPPSYRDRKPGGAASLPAPTHSPALHGKLWLSEDDTKTFLAPPQKEKDADDFNPRLGDRYIVEQAHARALGRALTGLTGVGLMDLWGEGWLADEAMWDKFGSFAARYKTFLHQHDRAETPEVVALIDEKSLLHVQRGEVHFRRLTNGLRDTLQRAGIRYGTYLQSDLAARDFPTNAKLYLFLTPYRLTQEQRALIREKLHGDEKTLVWLYSPCACVEYPGTPGTPEENAHGAIGFTLRPQEWNSEVGSRIIEPYHPITERMPTREFGARERINPSFYVADRDATVLAEYQGSGLPSLAAKNFGAWKSVFIGESVIPTALLRGLCRYAGVHLWMPQGDDVVSIGNGWVMVHASRDGHRTLFLPERAAIYDMTERRLIADEAREYRFFLRSGTTRIFAIGTTERFARLGLPNVTQPGESRARIVLDSTPETRAEEAPPAPRNDLETLKAVLSMDVSELEGEPLPDDDDDDDAPAEAENEGEATAVEETSGEMIAGGRRRRRRGGRGRWRKKTDGAGEGDAPPNPPAPFPEGKGSEG